MANRTSHIIRKLFPDDFEELVPAKIRWWRRIDFSIIKTKWGRLLLIVMSPVVLYLGVHYYNHLVTLETQVLTDQAQIEAQLQRRKDLIINLTTTVMDYREHERIMFKYMADKRAGSLEKADILKDALEGRFPDLSKLKPADFEGALAKFMALAEAYPDLKLSSNFQKLMDALVDTENRIVECRMAYNRSCNIYLTYRRQFPQKAYVRLFFGFRTFPFIKVDEDVSSAKWNVDNRK